MTEPLTVLTWLWAQPGGRATYTAHHVNVWADMVRRNLTIPHRLACVTDTPDGIDPRVSIITPPGDFEDVRIPTWGGDRPQCLRRISMFRTDAAGIFGRRFVSMDMDCVVSGNIDDLFTRGEDIVLYKSPSSPQFENPRPYNGSMLLMTAGVRPQVFNRFTPEGAVAAGKQFAGSDQAWISYVLGAGEATWSESDGVYWWGRWRQAANPRLIFYPGFPKPWDLVGCSKFVTQHYHRDRRGRCLILGYAKTVWAEATAAVSAQAFDAVIASPEAAAHWPGEVTAVAETDFHAERMAKILGFEEVRFCGRSERSAA